MVREIEDLNQHFPDYAESQLPDRDYMFTVLATLRLEILQNMITNARRNRAKDNQDDDSELVHISEKMYQEINSVMTGKCK